MRHTIYGSNAYKFFCLRKNKSCQTVSEALSVIFAKIFAIFTLSFTLYFIDIHLFMSLV